MAITLDIIDSEKNKKGEIELLDDIFNQETKEHLMHQAVVSYLTNQRSGTASTKTRSEVRGSGAKPWRQKGTGRARMGSIRSPLRRGGGIVFGPKPRDFKDRLTKKEKQKALRSSLSLKVKEGNFTVVEEVNLDQPKTKQLISFLRQIDFKGNVMFIISGENKNLELAARNLKGVNVCYPNSLNTYQVLYHDKIICTKEAVLELSK